MRTHIGVAILSVAMLGTVASAAAQSHSDKEFLEKSSQGNVAEVETAKLALKKSTNPDVRAFAERMIHDHQMLGRKMAPYLVKAGVQGSTSLNMEHQHLYNKLNGLSGAEFDKQYVEAMDKDHHQDLEAFQKEVSSTQDQQLKDVVASGEKVIAEHTHMIDDISRKMGMTPAGA